MELQELKEKFEHIFGADDQNGEIRAFFAPGRVNLIGEHTDYNGGHALPCALPIGTYGLARLTGGKNVSVVSLNIDETVRTFDPDQIVMYDPAGDGWTGYIKGVFWVYGQRGAVFPKGCQILIWGNIPGGLGLASSASLGVLTAEIIRELYHVPNIDNTELAVLAQRAESKFVGTNCGIMDQFASAMGKKDNAIFLDTEHIKYEYVPLKLGSAKIVITNSRVRREMSTAEYNQRRKECEKALKKLKTVVNINNLCDLGWDQFESCKDVIMDDTLIRRARHAVYENARTIRAVNALRVNNIRRFGALMNESHASLRDDYEVSCPEIDYLVETAQSLPGTIGSRLMGGGFGGCTVSLVEEASIPEFKEKLYNGYKAKYGLEASFYVVEAGDGVRELPLA
ncbi:MAG: galactokinase [Eubacteriales bacterium]|jgi:galactokinase